MTTTRRTIGSMTWWDYVQSVTRGRTNVAIADLVGVTPSSVGKWKESLPHPVQAAAFARAFDRPVIEAFVYAGYLTEDEAGALPGTALPDVTQLDDDALLAEVRRRIKEGGQDGRQPEAEKKIMTDGGADGQPETGGDKAVAGQQGARRASKGRGGMTRTRREK